MGFPIKKYKQQPAHIRFQFNSGKKYMRELLNIEYLVIFCQYFGNFIQEFFVVWPHNCLCKISKILAELNKVFNFEKSLIYVLPKLLHSCWQIWEFYLFGRKLRKWHKNHSWDMKLVVLSSFPCWNGKHKIL